MTRIRHQPDYTKKLILDCALVLFKEKGYKNTTTDDICRMAQMSKGNLYHHFKNKEEIFLTILSQYTEDMIYKWKNISSDKSSIDQLTTLGELFAKESNNVLIRSTIEFSKNIDNNTRVIQIYNELLKITLDSIKEIVQQGISTNEFKNTDADEIVYTFYALLVGISQLNLNTPGLSEEQFTKLYKTSIKHLFEGIAT